MEPGYFHPAGPRGFGSNHRLHRRREEPRLQPGYEFRDRAAEPEADSGEDAAIPGGVRPRTLPCARQRPHRKLALGRE